MLTYAYTYIHIQTNTYKQAHKYVYIYTCMYNVAFAFVCDCVLVTLSAADLIPWFSVSAYVTCVLQTRSSGRKSQNFSFSQHLGADVDIEHCSIGLQIARKSLLRVVLVSVLDFIIAFFFLFFYVDVVCMCAQSHSQPQVLSMSVLLGFVIRQVQLSQILHTFLQIVSSSI